MGIVNARLIFYEWLNYKKFSLAASPHHLAKCVICIFAKFVCFTNLWKHENTKNAFSHICKIVKNSKKFSYTWFISPRIIYCLVPRQPPIWGVGVYHGGPVTKSVHFSWRGDFAKCGLYTFCVHHIFNKFIFYKNLFL